VPDSVRAARFGGLATLDSDSDGVSDLQEQKAGTNALDARHRPRRLSDGVEAAHGSNALSIDSDSDGLTDSFESASGTLEPAAQPASPAGRRWARVVSGRWRGWSRGRGSDPLAAGTPGTGTDDLAAVDPYGH
jgi:hypothetical protein